MNLPDNPGLWNYRDRQGKMQTAEVVALTGWTKGLAVKMGDSNYRQITDYLFDWVEAS